jgi:hypothetical protein
MCGGVCYNTWLYQLFRRIWGGCCLSPAGVCELHLYHVLPSHIYSCVHDLEDWSALPMELFVYRQSAFFVRSCNKFSEAIHVISGNIVTLEV